MTESNRDGPCTVCNTPNARLCGKCKSTRYCTLRCQQMDWPTHNLLCANFSSFKMSIRPTKQHYRAILFPVDEATPEFFWLHCPCVDGGYQIEEILGLDAVRTEVPIQFNSILSRRLANTILFCYRKDFFIDGSKPNQSVASVAATKSGQLYDWRGPIVAWGRGGQGMNSPACRDLDMVDFRHITDYIFPYHYGPAGGVLNFPDDCLWGTVKCVRINCIGDEQICKRPRFESVGVGLADPIFSENDTSDIADRAGFPIIMRKFSPDPKWLNLGRKDNPSVLYGLQNVNATFLNISCKLSGNIADGVDGFALAPKKYHDYPGSIIVARRDMRPLLPIHAEALCAYCLFEVSPALCSSVENGEKSDRLEIQAALDNICRRTFSSYWRKFVEKKREGDKWLDAPSPFDD